jgi:hypothetical protein
MAAPTVDPPTPDAVRSPLPDLADLVQAAGLSYPFLSYLAEGAPDGEEQDGDIVEDTAFDAVIFESLIHP